MAQVAHQGFKLVTGGQHAALFGEAEVSAVTPVRRDGLIDKSKRIKEQGVIEDPKLYQEIFDKLSKSVFLEEALP